MVTSRPGVLLMAAATVFCPQCSAASRGGPELPLSTLPPCRLCLAAGGGGWWAGAPPCRQCPPPLSPVSRGGRRIVSSCRRACLIVLRLARVPSPVICCHRGRDVQASVTSKTNTAAQLELYRGALVNQYAV